MGGKTWSAEEERYFWLEIIPQSPSAVRLKDRLQTWDACAGLMQRAMGEPRRRDYTKTMLYEHYYQNIKTGSHSPRARQYVRQHKHEISVAAEEEQTREHEEREQFLQEQTTRERATREQTAREQTISPTLTSLPKLHSKLPLPIPREPKLYWKDDTPFMSGVDPRGMKRTAEFNEDHHPAKRHQLNPFEPPAEPQLSSITQIRQASEDWLTHPLPRLLPRPIAQPRTRLPSTRFDMAGASRDEFRPHFSHERIELPPIAPVVSPPSGNMSAFDALLWASKIRANELAPTPSQSGSQSRSRSISPNTTPDESAVGDLYEAGPGAKSNPALA